MGWLIILMVVFGLLFSGILPVENFQSNTASQNQTTTTTPATPPSTPASSTTPVTSSSH